MRKTTLYLDEETTERLRSYAAAAGRTQAAIVREAVRAYVVGSKRRPRSIGLGKSGRGDLSERAEQLLAGMGDDS